MPYIQWTSRGLTLLWTGFWTFFCIGSAFLESQSARESVTDVATAAVFCAAAVGAWRYERVGGLALMAVAVAAFLFFGVYSRPYSVWLVFAAPPLVAGILFIMHSRGGLGKLH